MKLSGRHITDPKWGKYSITVQGIDDEETYHVLNGKGQRVNVEWATYEGASACAELLAEGYLRE